MGARMIIEAESAESEQSREELAAFAKSLEAEFPQLDSLYLYFKSNGSLHVSTINVKREFRGQGVGTRVMERIKQFAAERGVPVTLSPEADRGKKAALQKFYGNLDFKRERDSRYTSPFGPTLSWHPSRSAD